MYSDSQTLFMNSARTLAEHCIDGITANADVCRYHVEHSISLVTALNPVILRHGEQLAAKATGQTRHRGTRGEKKILTDEQIADVLTAKMTVVRSREAGVTPLSCKAVPRRRRARRAVQMTLQLIAVRVRAFGLVERQAAIEVGH